MEQLLLLAGRESLFALMFVILFIYQILDSRKREEKLMNFIQEITEQYAKLAKQYENLARDVSEIKNEINKIL